MAFRSGCKDCFAKFLSAPKYKDWNVWGKSFKYGKYIGDNGCPCIDANMDNKIFSKWIEKNSKDAFYNDKYYTVIVERITPAYMDEDIDKQK